MARKVGLSLEHVVEQAALLADEEGLPGLTLLRLAERLGVRSPSLYTHVTGREGLHRAVSLYAAQVLAADMRKAVSSAKALKDPLFALDAFAHAYRAFSREHPGLYAAVQRGVTPDADPELADSLNKAVAIIADILSRMGLPASELIHSVRTVRSAIHGFVTLQAQGGFGLPEDTEDSFRRMIETLKLGLAAQATQAAQPVARR